MDEKRKQLTYTLPLSCTKSKNSPHMKRRDIGERTLFSFPLPLHAIQGNAFIVTSSVCRVNWGEKLNTPKNICFLWLLFLLLLRPGLMYPKLPSNSLFLKLTLNLLPTSSRGLGLQVCGIASGFYSVGDLTQGFVNARQTLLQLSYSSDPTFLFFTGSHLFQLFVARK